MSGLGGPWWLLTKNEARNYLRDGTLPENFRTRLEHLIEFGSCSNCDGVEDMNVVCRDWWQDEPTWCGDCVVTDGKGARVDA